MPAGATVIPGASYSPRSSASVEAARSFRPRRTRLGMPAGDFRFGALICAPVGSPSERLRSVNIVRTTLKPPRQGEYIKKTQSNAAGRKRIGRSVRPRGALLPFSTSTSPRRNFSALKERQEIQRERERQQPAGNRTTFVVPLKLEHLRRGTPSSPLRGPLPPHMRRGPGHEG